MALVIDSKVGETSTTTGTGTYTLAGAISASWNPFTDIGDTNTTYYLAEEDGVGWELGLGTFTLSGTTLARTTILKSSNSDVAVNWAAGTRNIYVVTPDFILQYLFDSGLGGNGTNTANGTNSFSGGGTDNVVNGDVATISGGDQNAASANYSTCSGGQLNSAIGTHATVAGGETNSAGGANSTVSGGETNGVTGAAPHGTIGGGIINSVTADFGTIAGGSNNDVDSDYGTVAGGFQNDVNGNYGFIGGGRDNIITVAFASASVVGGEANTTAGDHSVIVGGKSNTASGPHGFIGAGETNDLTSATTHSSIVGGSANQITENYGVISGGRNNLVNSEDSYIPGGKEATTRDLNNCGAIAGNKFSVQGDAQVTKVVLMKQTTDATAGKMTSDGGVGNISNMPVLPVGYAFYMTGKVLAWDSTNSDRAAFSVEVLVYRDSGGTMSLQYQNITTDDPDDLAAWVVSVTANNTNKAIELKCQGTASQTINWVGYMEIIEIGQP